MTTVEKNEQIQIDRLELGPFATNAYILVCKKTGESVLVDAPGDAEKVLKALEGTHPRYILMTHNHFDHTGALKALKAQIGVPVAAHNQDAPHLPVPADVILKDGDFISFGQIRLEALHTPGHTPGSLCFFTDRFLISGDTLFPGGPGKTMSPRAFQQICRSLENKVFVLPGETTVYPGHGGEAVLKKEKQAYDRFSERPHASNLCGDVVWDAS
jgi:glyoxylase-like metal-dependent hydrolase (beta-lactamase superfamily II)